MYHHHHEDTDFFSLLYIQIYTTLEFLFVLARLMSSVFKTAESITQVYLSTSSSSAEEFVEGVSDEMTSPQNLTYLQYICCCYGRKAKQIRVFSTLHS